MADWYVFDSVHKLVERKGHKANPTVLTSVFHFRSVG